MALPPSTFAERTEKEKGGRGSEDGGGGDWLQHGGCDAPGDTRAGSHLQKDTGSCTLVFIRLLWKCAFMGLNPKTVFPEGWGYDSVHISIKPNTHSTNVSRTISSETLSPHLRCSLLRLFHTRQLQVTVSP